MRNAKSNHTATTVDGWNLHLVRTQNTSAEPRNFPVILLPGLGSSGSYTFDLSPEISLADYLAELGWDVWTIELRGNGLSDKPQLFSSRGRWHTIDDLCEKDVPTCMDHVCMHTGNSSVHVIGHSMGGMILTGVLAKGGPTAARVRSATIVGSSCFLEGSWWSFALPFLPASKLLYSIPAGLGLRLYSNLAFTRLAIRMIDVLYFWPTNVNPHLARAVLSRNFSSISPGEITQFASSFGKKGLRSGQPPYTPFCDPERLASVETPVFMICGDRDKMCPPQGAVKQHSMLTNSVGRKIMIVGPEQGFATHFGHFDILMGKTVATDVFPRFHEWLCTHDALEPLSAVPLPADTPAADTMGGVESKAAVGHLSPLPLPVNTLIAPELRSKGSSSSSTSSSEQEGVTSSFGDPSGYGINEQARYDPSFTPAVPMYSKL